MKYNDAEELLASLHRWQVYLFHGKVMTPQPHFQVILNDDFNETWEMIYISVATSKVEERKNYIKFRNLSKETLVIVEQWEVAFFSKRCCFNCNDVKTCNIYQLYWEYLENRFTYVWELSKDILEKILNWIKESLLVSDYDKKAIWLYN